MWRWISIVLLTAAAVGGEGEKAGKAFAHIQADKKSQPVAKDSIDYSGLKEFIPPKELREIEDKVLSCLNEGHQSKAEEMLEEHILKLPEIKKIPLLVSEKKKAEALKIVEQHAEAYRDNQRLLFLYAACMRSRFEIEEAFPFFMATAKANEKTTTGQAAFLMLFLDRSPLAQNHLDYFFKSFEKLIEAHPDEILLHWMIAVECRSYNRNEQGVKHYKKILEKWNPGPVLVHQTYGNLLDGLKRFDEALVERRKAVELEPAHWSYDGLGNTLDFLGRYDEANIAHAKACEFAPTSAHDLGNWAYNAMLRKQYDEAIKKCQGAIEIDPSCPNNWCHWAMCLEAQGKKADALSKYREALERFPRNEYIKEQIPRLEKELKDLGE
jgi:tetratricopeptide (TPR) repeat protein